MIVDVAINKPLWKTLDYEVNENIECSVGSIVEVPFRNSTELGLVLGIKKKSSGQYSLKKINKIIEVSFLNKEQLQLLNFMSSYYCCPHGITATLFYSKNFFRESLKKIYGYQITASLNNLNSEKKTKKKKIIEVFQKKKKISHEDYKKFTNYEKKIINDLLKEGYLKKIIIEDVNDSLENNNNIVKDIELNLDQRNAFECVMKDKNSFKTFLLYGPTGSGKTEVYIAIAKQLNQADKQVLIMVPEINLTPQLEENLKNRFDRKHVCVYHSGVSNSEKKKNYDNIKSGKIKTIIGTRSSLFLSFKSLGAIIVDEEHDDSYKQNDGCRYSARDIAFYICKQKKIPLVLGSATPSIETYFKYLNNNISILNLPKRDLTKSSKILIEQNIENFDSLYKNKIKKLFIENKNIIFYVNRRGFNPLILCNSCKSTINCKKCSVSLTFHKTGNFLLCHQCNSKSIIPKNCDLCMSKDLVGIGDGTQKIEDELLKSFASEKIVRFDSDEIKNPSKLKFTLDKINNLHGGIIIGTQMVSKGHNFPKIALVLILGSDNALFSSDYRATEKLMQELFQVAGRAGRELNFDSEVIIRTKYPSNEIFKHLINSDYSKFLENTLQERKSLNYPPFSSHVLLRALSKNRKDNFDFLSQALKFAELYKSKDIKIYDIVPCVIEKINGKYRHQLLFQFERKTLMVGFLNKLVERLNNCKTKSTWYLDVDPKNLN